MNPQIVLTDKEQELFDFLIKKADEMPEHIDLRVTGGWVRDKLMGRQPNDIDIAIEGESQTISAEDFAITLKDKGGKIGSKLGRSYLDGKLVMTQAMLAVKPKPGADLTSIDLTSIVKHPDNETHYELA